MQRRLIWMVQYKRQATLFEKRATEHKDLKCHVLYNYRKGYIKLRTEEDEEIYYSVHGSLVKNPQIIEMKINTKEKITIKALTEHLRFNRFFFADKDRWLSLISNLQKFKVEAQKTIEDQNDNRGNVKELYEIKNTSNLDLSFDVMMPVFVGQPAKKFKVEIAYAVREKAIEVWLESPELAELERADCEAIINKELTRFPKTYVFIEQ